MKFLGWMHRKFQHKINEPFKDFSIGNSCGCLTGQTFLDDQQYPPLPNHCNKPHHIKGYKENNNFKNQNLLENYHDDDHYQDDHVRSDDDDEKDPELSGIFHGFLSIGTLGTNPAVYDDPTTTPTFFISVDNIMEKETQVTEDDVKLINDELEKVLGYDENCNLSSGRNSHVSTGRSSHVSTITLNPKPRESTENKINISCPLQTYLLGSSIGYQETTINSSSGNKEHRVSVSLGELFQKKKLNEEGDHHEEQKSGKMNIEMKTEKKADKSGPFILKKMLKRKKNYGSSTSNNEAYEGGASDSISYEKKLQKILQIFHRKVHPDSSSDAKKTIKKKLGLKGGIKAGGNGNGLAHQHADAGPSNGKIRDRKSPSNTDQIELNGSSSFGIGPGGHWIKSDSDFLVLEL